MAEKNGYPHGVFSWVDLSARDQAAAAAWYAELFGWDYQPGQDPNMPYGMFFKSGKVLCGIGELTEEMQAAGVPPMWNSYVNVDDANAVQAKVEASGGTVNVPVMQVADFGAMAFFCSPDGASFGVWQPGTHTGAQLVNEDGAFTWNELLSTDLEKAQAFYKEVFGWTYDSVDMPTGAKYHMAKNDGAMNCGMMDMPPQVQGVPSHWAVYFHVDDLAAFTAKAKAAGATFHVENMDIGQGTIATLADPQGAVFSVIQPKSAG